MSATPGKAAKPAASAAADEPRKRRLVILVVAGLGLLLVALLGPKLLAGGGGAAAPQGAGSGRSVGAAGAAQSRPTGPRPTTRHPAASVAGPPTTAAPAGTGRDPFIPLVTAPAPATGGSGPEKGSK